MTEKLWDGPKIPVRDRAMWRKDWVQDAFVSAAELRNRDRMSRPIARWTYRRGSGQTSRQMIAAPIDALYIVGAGSNARYYDDLRRHLGRGDLRIENISRVVDGGHRIYLGSLIGGLVIDHAVMLSDHDCSALHYLMRSCAFHTRDWMNPEPKYIEQGTDKWIVTVAPIEPE